MKDFFITVYRNIKLMFKSVSKELIRNSKSISIIILIMNPLITLMLYNTNTKFALSIMVVMYVVSYTFYILFNQFRTADNLPKPNKKYVSINGNEASIKKEELYELIAYLYELELYFDSHGVYDEKKKWYFFDKLYDCGFGKGNLDLYVYW